LSESPRRQENWSRLWGEVERGKGNGPRSTPTVDDDRSRLTETGDLACLPARATDRRSGAKTFERVSAEQPRLVDQRNRRWLTDRVIVIRAGARGWCLGQDEGKVVEGERLSDEAAYSSAIGAATSAASAHNMNFTLARGWAPRSDGKLMWSLTSPPPHANWPRRSSPTSKVFFTSAYGEGRALLGLSAQDGDVRPRRPISPGT